MADEHELPAEIYRSILALSAQGDALGEAGNYKDAFVKFSEAWGLLPEPKNQWAASTWLLAAIADVSYLGGFKTSARKALEYAMTCPGGLGNPFLHLRYGQLLFDSGEMDRAADELMRAYMGDGPDIFEAEDPRYLEFLGTRANLGG